MPHIDTAMTVRKRTERNAKNEVVDDVDDEDSEEEDDESEQEEEDQETESDIESEGFVDDGERFEDQLDFMHL